MFCMYIYMYVHVCHGFHLLDVLGRLILQSIFSVNVYKIIVL